MIVCNFDYEWKSLVNAIVHDNFDPRLHFLSLKCDNCGEKFQPFYLLHKEEATTPDGQILHLEIRVCPSCGKSELSISGTYHLSDLDQKTIDKFAAHYSLFWGYMSSVAVKELKEP